MMATLICIANWAENFENNRTRDMKSMAWVPFPNKMDGDGYTELLDHADGALHYAAWVAMVLAASKCRSRGTLLRDGGRPHDSASLARITRIPKAALDAAIPRLAKIGWIELKSLPDNESHQPAEKPQEGAAATQATDYGMERNGTEGNTNTPLPPKGERGEQPDPFEKFWQAVHVKTGRDAAKRAYAKAVRRIGMGRDAPPDPHAYLLDRMLAFARSPSAKPPDRTPIHPATWLNQGRYDDDPATWEQTGSRIPEGVPL